MEFVHREGRRPMALPQIMGPGLVFRDLDQDGLADLVFVQGSGDGSGPPPRFAYFRNKGDGTFADATGPSGLSVSGWGMGALAADLDADGDADLVFTFYGDSPAGFENQGDGTFRPFALPPDPLPGVPFGSGLAALDPDRRGILDIFAASYVDFPRSRIGHSDGVAIRGNWQPRALSPFLAAPRPSLYYRASGRLTYRQIAREVGCDNRDGKGLAAVVLDVDADGRQDLFVANDVSPCALFRSVSPEVFENVAVASWLADVGGSMGLALGDYDHDGQIDIFCSRWVAEFHALYRANRRKDGRLYFTNLAEVTGLSELGTNHVGWGCAFLDVTGDGWEDLLVLEGHTFVDLSHEALIAQPPVLLVSEAGRRFVPYPAAPGSLLATPLSARGAAFADYDNDGAVDVAVAQNRGAARLWRGVPPPGHWLSLELVGTSGNRDAIGARVHLSAGPLSLTRTVTSGDSYLSASSPRLTFRIAAGTAARVTITWPSGTVQELGPVAGDRVVRVVEP